MKSRACVVNVDTVTLDVFRIWIQEKQRQFRGQRRGE